MDPAGVELLGVLLLVGVTVGHEVTAFGPVPVRVNVVGVPESVVLADPMLFEDEKGMYQDEKVITAEVVETYPISSSSLEVSSN